MSNNTNNVVVGEVFRVDPNKYRDAGQFCVNRIHYGTTKTRSTLKKNTVTNRRRCVSYGVDKVVTTSDFSRCFGGPICPTGDIPVKIVKSQQIGGLMDL